MIDKGTVDNILDAAQIVDVVGDFVSLKRRGANYIACCPFHHEKTPSFSVSPSKGIYKCFGCGKVGSAVGFVMEHEQLTYPEGLKYLAKKYGIPIVEKEETQEDIDNRLKRESLILVSEFGQKYFTENLLNSQKGRAIGLSYFKERGFSKEIIDKFQLGYSSDERTGLVTATRQANYNLDYLTDTGLAIKREETGEYVDRFYDRVMFPIHSISGRVIAFGGRTLKTDKKIAKYINSPETEIYVKSRSLYGIYQAKGAITSKQKCYLVEGYTDVISLHQAGIENVVASSGTSLTKEQIGLIKRFSSNVTVLYDGDSAGIKASIRGIDMFLQEGITVKVVLFPNNEDPDSFARSRSKEELLEFLDNSEQDFLAFKSELLSEEIGKDPLKRAQLISEVINSIAIMPDAITRAVYIEESSKKLNIEESLLKQEVAKLVRKKQIELLKEKERKDNEKRENTRFSSGNTTNSQIYYPEQSNSDTKIPDFVTEAYCEFAEKELIYYLLKFGESILHLEEEMYIGAEKDNNLTVSQYILSELQTDELELKHLVYKNLFDEYFQLKDHTQDRIIKHFLNHPSQEISILVADIIVQEHTLTIKHFIKSLIPEENILGKSVPKAVLVYKSKIAEEANRDLCTALGNAQKSKDKDLQDELMEQIRIIMHVRNTFAKELNRLTL